MVALVPPPMNCPSLGRLLLLAGCFLGAVACGPGGSGGTGDARTQPNANPYGTGKRLAEVIGPATWEDASDIESDNCPDIPRDFEVFVTGVVVVAHDNYDETGSGASGNYYVQDVLDPPAEYSGITVFEPGFSPPDLRVLNGDVLDIFGLFTEFVGPTVGRFGYCRTLPEMSGSVEFRFEGASVNPVKILPSDLATYAASRKYMGMLVEVENVRLSEDPYDPGSGRYSIRIETNQNDATQEIPSITNELMDLKSAYPDLVRGQVIPRVRGIVTYFYGVHLAPRSAADITL